MDNVSDQEPGKKFCPRCQDEKLITEFYLATRTNAKEGSPRRRMHWCIECHKKYSAQRRRNLLATKGQAYRDQENARVRKHMSQQEAVDKRRAAERAKQRAMRELRLRHTREYAALLNAARQLEGLPTQPRPRPEKSVEDKAA